MANNRLDIIIFGATGYTGKFVVKRAAYICKQEKIKFGVAGRRKETLETVIKEFASDIGKTKFLFFSINRIYSDLII